MGREAVKFFEECKWCTCVTCWKSWWTPPAQFEFSPARLDAFKPERPWWRTRDSIVLRDWVFSPSLRDAVAEMESCMLCADVAGSVRSRNIRCVHGHAGTAARECGHPLVADLAVCADCDAQRTAGDKALVRADFCVDPIWCIPGDGRDQVLHFLIVRLFLLIMYSQVASV